MPAKPIPIPWPLSSSPGSNSQESGGRLINAYAELLGEAGPGKYKWPRSAGLSQHAVTGNSGYRGGLIVNGESYETWGNVAETVDILGAVASIGDGIFPGTQKISIARNQASPTPDVIAVDLDNGAYVLESAAVVKAQVVATIGGSSFMSGDVVSMTILNPAEPTFPVSVSYTLGGGESATTVATGLKNLINADATLLAANVNAVAIAGVLTVLQSGSIGNQTSAVAGVTGTGNETVTFNPTSGNMIGGQGTFGAFNGNPTPYTANGILPQANSVCFQDGYFFLTTGDGRIFATQLNGLSVNALTFITVQAKADVQLLRGVAFSGLLLAFTTGSIEVWQDAALPAPNFPYSRVAVLEVGLAQANAIAGWETGFSELIWVAQDFGVHWMTAGGMTEIKISPPDLDRLIETAVRAGEFLEADCYIAGGKKFWNVSSPSWTWELNLQTKKWSERQSLLTTGEYGRWRASGGHPAFGKWLCGDRQSGNLLYFDDANFTENGAPQLWQMESGPVREFPAEQRVARADFDFVTGVGETVGSFTMSVTGAASSPSGGVVRLSVGSTSNVTTNDVVQVSGVLGTTEANGVWQMNVIDSQTLDLVGSTFANAYSSGGSAVDLTAPSGEVMPQVAVSMSRDGGRQWGNPLLRPLGAQSKSRRARVSVSNMGQPGPNGARWRLAVTDPVYVSFMGGTQSSSLRPVGP